MTTFINMQSTRKERLIYWCFTIIFFLLDSLMPALTFNTQLAKEGVRHLGYPDYFRIELSVGKIIGGLLLILPLVPVRLKEWAYVGFGISLISAIIAHVVVDQDAGQSVLPVVGLVILSISYIYFHKIKVRGF